MILHLNLSSPIKKRNGKVRTLKSIGTKSLFLVLSVSTFLLFSCKKELENGNLSNQTGVAPTPKASSSSRIEPSDQGYSDAELVTAIASIKFQANRIPDHESPSPTYTAPDLGDLSVEETIFLLEVTHNYDATVGPSWLVDQQYTTEYSIPLNAVGSINQNELVTAYDILFGRIEANTPEDHGVYVCDVWGTQLTESSLDIKLEVDFYMNPEVAPAVDPLGPEDDWKAFNYLGKCNGQYAGYKDATTRLDQLIEWYANGWGGSSASSTGGIVQLCNNTAQVPVYTYVTNWPGGNSWYSEYNTSTYPLSSCSPGLCLNENEMEQNLVDYFNLWNNTISTTTIGGPGPWEFLRVSYTSAFDNTTGACNPYPLWYHKIRTKIGVANCTQTLPW